MNATFNRTPLCYLPDKKWEILSGKAANPAIQHALNVVMRAEAEDFMDHFRQSPVPLEAVGLDSEAVASLNIGFPEAGEARVHFVLALVIVHAHLLVFFEGGVVLAEDFGFGSSWTEFEFKVKVQGYGVGIGSHCSFAEAKQR